MDDGRQDEREKTEEGSGMERGTIASLRREKMEETVYHG
jgi:hypothetical protein